MSDLPAVPSTDGDVPATPDARRWRVLFALCFAVFVINLDGTIVNIALPSLVRQLHATTSDTQWIVDAYNLCFAALVLAAGSLGDRFGRKGALLAGLAVFGAGALAGSLATSIFALIAARAVMGLGAAVVFPSTLSIISNVFTDRSERAKAIGAWGATTGVGIAFGPIVGGFLLDRFWWGSVFLVMAPIAVIAIGLAVRLVPTSRDPAAPRLDIPGLLLSTVTLGVLVYTVIEAPLRGWSSRPSIAGYLISAAALTAFIVVERRTKAPMMDVLLFTNPRFSAASGSVTVAFFTLGGFVFMITMYFQFMHGYSPLSTGVRLLPVALSVGVASGLGTQLALKVGNKAVVSTGLALMGIGFFWISRSSAHTSYFFETIGQMVVTAIGVGLSSAPATEAIMGVVPKEKAGIGSATNDATRELGGTLGVAVIGSIFGSLYLSSLRAANLATSLPSNVAAAAQRSVGTALTSANSLSQSQPRAAALLRAASDHAFFRGFQSGCEVAAVVAVVGAVLAGLLLPAHPSDGSLTAETRMTDSDTARLAAADSLN